MGGAVSVELNKPVDASDITESQSVEVAKCEVIRLRAALGHLAKAAGFAEVVYDASDLVHGMDELEDFNRCVAEIVHIRSALRLSTQGSKRKTRVGYTPTAKSFFDEKEDDEDEEEEDEDSDDDEGKDEKDEEDHAEKEAAASVGAVKKSTHTNDTSGNDVKEIDGVDSGIDGGGGGGGSGGSLV